MTINTRIGNYEAVNAVQVAIFNWGRRVFGLEEMLPRRRALRLFEEVTELCQSEGIDGDMLIRQIGVTYDRPVGDPAKELGGVLVTALAYAEARNWSAGYVLDNEIARIDAKPPIVFQDRLEEKLEAGLE